MKSFIVLIILSSSVSFAKTPEVKITAKDKFSEQAKTVLADLLTKYDLSPYIYTKEVVIESNIIPHSHPILTLKAEEKDKPDVLLGTFIHEQMHWYWIESSPGRDVGPRVDFKKKYKTFPVNPPEGASGESSTLQHLGVCWLEYQGLVQTIGIERARKVISEKPYYTWIYKKVLEDTDFIAGVMKKYKMDKPAGH
jgi:hypothetical protein